MTHINLARGGRSPSRLENEAPAVWVDFALPWGFGLSWTTNRYGTERDHVTLVYRIGPGTSPRRDGAWAGEGGAR